MTRKKPVAPSIGRGNPGVEFDPSQGHGAHLEPGVQNVIKLTLAFMKAVGENQKDKGENLVVSPYNALAALSMVSKGAEAKTREEFAKSLFGTDAKHLDAAADGYADLNNRILEANKGQVELTTANGVWANNKVVTLRDDFADDLKKTFGAEVSAENFSPATVKKVNDWADKNTKGLIKEVLDNLDADAAAVLASSLYFKGQWTRKFDKALTEDKTFTADDSKTSHTPTMHKDYGRKDGLTFVQDADYTAVALTYGEEDRRAGKNPTMRIVLVRPSDDSVSARDWLSKQAGSIPQWLDPNAFQAATGSVELPRLDIKQKHDLIPSLQDLGIKKAFQEGAANFSRMFEEGGKEVYISKVSHDVVFKTDEQGSEAAAVTVIGMTRSAVSMPPPMPHVDIKLDRSFVFALQDVETGAVLFMGTVNKPNNDMKAAPAAAKPRQLRR